MIENLNYVCNKSPLVFIYGSNVSNATRTMMQTLSGDYTFVQVTHFDTKNMPVSKEHLASVNPVAKNVMNGVRKINLISYSVYLYAKTKLQPSYMDTYWVWCDTDVSPDVVSDFYDTVKVNAGRIVDVTCQEVKADFDEQRSMNLGRWYSMIMSFYYDVLDRVTYQNMALFLINIYSFIEYACSSKGEPRNIATCKKELGPGYFKTLGTLFQLRLLFTTEPYNRKEIWELMAKVLDDDMFYELLQLYFMQSYKELDYLHQLKHLVAIEISKEGS